MDEERVRVTLLVFLVKAADIGKSGLEQFTLVAGEIVLRFVFKHFEAVENGFGSAQVERFFATGRVRDLAEEKPRILRLQKEELVEAGIRLRVMRHGRNIAGAEPSAKQECQ
jgi:hypothetical protein